MNAVQMPLAEPSALTDSRSAGKVATSREAFWWLNETGRRRTEQERVLDFIEHSVDGATSHEICDALELSMQSASGRLNELYRAGLIARDGRKRTPPYGRAAYVWFGVNAGLVPSAGASSNSKWEGSDVPADGLSAGERDAVSRL